jgi:hypothetical protein
MLSPVYPSVAFLNSNHSFPHTSMLVIELAEAVGRAGLRVGRHRPARTAARPERLLECTYPVRSSPQPAERVWGRLTPHVEGVRRHGERADYPPGRRQGQPP